MENFFIADKFYSDLDDLLCEMDIDESNVNDLEEDWTCKIELSELQPMFQLKAADLAEMLFNNNEDRYSEDAPEDDKIVAALKECFDFEKFNSMVPKLYYGNNKYHVLTKNDIVEYCK